MMRRRGECSVASVAVVSILSITGTRGTAMRSPAFALRLRGGSGPDCGRPLSHIASGADSHLTREFVAAAEYARQMPGVPTEDKLVFYGLFKQATVGPCNIPEPSCFAWSDKAKWQRWHDLEGLNPAAAAKKYIEHLEHLAPNWRGKNRPPQFQDIGGADDSSDHLSSSSVEDTEWQQKQNAKLDSSSGDSQWDESPSGARRTADGQEGKRGEKAAASSHPGVRLEQRMRLQAPTVPPSAKGIPEWGIRPIHEEHADQMKFAHLMDLLIEQQQGKYIPELHTEENKAILKHFYKRLAEVSDIEPYAIPSCKNYSLTGDALKEAKLQRQYLWEKLTSEIKLTSCGTGNVTDDELEARFKDEDDKVERWFFLREKYMDLMGQIGDFQMTSTPPLPPPGHTPTQREVERAEKRAKKNADTIHKLEVDLMKDADVLLWAVGGTHSRKPNDKTLGRCEQLKISSLINGSDTLCERDWMHGARERFHRDHEPLFWARRYAGFAMAYYRLYVVGGYDVVRQRISSVVESIDPFGCGWRTEAPLPCPRAEVGVAPWKQLELYAVGGWLPQSSTTNPTHTAQTTTATSSTSGSESVSGGGSGGKSENGNSIMHTSGAAHECACNICSAIRNMHTTHVIPSDKALIPDSSDTDSEGTLDETVCNISSSSNSNPNTTREEEEEVKRQADEMDKMQREDAESMPREMASSSCGKNSSLFWTAPQGSSASRNVDVYHSKTNLWRTLEHLHLPAPRAGAGVVCLGGRLYVCGGSDGTQAMRTVWSIDPEELDATWREEAPLQQARAGISGACVAICSSTGGEAAIMVCGGRSDSGLGLPKPRDVLKSVEVFSLRQGKWNGERALRTERWAAACASHNGRVYVVGGCDAFGVALCGVFSFQPGDKYWREEPDLVRARAAHSVGVVVRPTNLHAASPEPDTSDSDEGMVSWNTVGGFGSRDDKGKLLRKLQEGIASGREVEQGVTSFD